MAGAWPLGDNPWLWPVAVLLGAAHVLGLAWLILDVRQRRRRSAVWVFFYATLFGPFLLLPWLVVRRRSPVVTAVPAKSIPGIIWLALAIAVSAIPARSAFTTFAFQAHRAR